MLMRHPNPLVGLAQPALRPNGPHIPQPSPAGWVGDPPNFRGL